MLLIACRRRRHAATLVELVLSTAICAAVLVPALVMMRDALRLNDRIGSTNTLGTLCASKLEQHLALAAADFSEFSGNGSYSAEGQPAMRYEVTRSTNSAAGGIADRLMAIHVNAWHDLDADLLRDADEPQVSMSTKVAKLASYQNVANP